MSQRPTLYSTAPPYRGEDPGDYARQVASVARWSEQAGCSGILVYTDNSLLDPWLVAQVVLQTTRSLAPLVAIQPVYMHPYSAAKMIATLSLLYGRRVDLNMLAGGFKNDLVALGDDTPHDRRYDRMVEFTEIVKRLCAGQGPVSLTGEFYRVHKLTLKPRVAPQLQPRILASGSSEAGLAAARAIGALPVHYPAPSAQLGATSKREDGTFVYANDAAARMAGFGSVEAYVGAGSYEVSRQLSVMDADGRPFPYDRLPARRAFQGEPAPEMVVQFRRADSNDVRWSRTQARTVRGE